MTSIQSALRSFSYRSELFNQGFGTVINHAYFCFCGQEPCFRHFWFIENGPFHVPKFVLLIYTPHTWTDRFINGWDILAWLAYHTGTWRIEESNKSETPYSFAANSTPVIYFNNQFCKTPAYLKHFLEHVQASLPLRKRQRIFFDPILHRCIWLRLSCRFFSTAPHKVYNHLRCDAWEYQNFGTEAAWPTVFPSSK